MTPRRTGGARIVVADWICVDLVSCVGNYSMDLATPVAAGGLAAELCIVDVPIARDAMVAAAGGMLAVNSVHHREGSYTISV